MLVPVLGQTDTGYVSELLRKLGASDFVARTTQFLLVRPLRIVLVIVAAWLVVRVCNRLATRLARSLRLRTPMLGTSARAESRVATVGGAMASLFRVFVWLIAVLTILGELNIKLAPFIAGATVIGAAVGFGAQSLVRDFLSGLLILVEDQYGVGDDVSVGEVIGTVEGINLRTTRLRAPNGVVWYVPNGEIRKVGNRSDTFSRQLIDIAVPPGTDLDAASRIIEEEATAVVGDPAWADAVLARPAVLGAVDIGKDGTELRLSVQVVPAQGAPLARALRTRVQGRLDREGMGWAQHAPSAPVAAPDSRPPAAGKDANTTPERESGGSRARRPDRRKDRPE